MRSLPQPTEEECFRTHREATNSKDWKELDDECKAQQKASLIANQGGICAYCEREIHEGNSHIDHIRPKGRAEFVRLTFEVANIVASCGLCSGVTCGHAKGNKVLPDSLHPYEQKDLADFFYVRVDGTLATKSGVPVEVEEAINHTLNLNDDVLKGQREQHLAMIRGYEGQEGLTNEDIAGFFKGFPSLTARTFGL